MRDSAANAWTAYLNASGATDDAQLDFPPGVTQILVATPAATYAVSGTDKVINFLNLDGSNSNTYLIAVLTRSA